MMYKKLKLIIFVFVFINLSIINSYAFTSTHPTNDVYSLKWFSNEFIKSLCRNDLEQAEVYLNKDDRKKIRLDAWRWVLLTSGAYKGIRSSTVVPTKPLQVRIRAIFNNIDRTFAIDFKNNTNKINNIKMIW